MKVTKPKLVDEKPKADVGRQVVTPTRKYFVPEYGEVEARDLADLPAALKKRKRKKVTHDAS